jgi:hypothetical protein
MKLPGMVPPAGLPDAGALIPAIAVRVVFVVAGVLLSLVDFGLTGWLAVGIVLSAATARSPRHLLGWVLILFLAAGRLAHHPSLSWRFLVLLAGVHLLHVLSLLVLELPWRSWVQPSVFLSPLLRFLMIQVPTQLLAVLALLLLAPRPDGHRPVTVAGFAVVGAAALAGLALLLSRRRLDEGRSPPAVGGAQPQSGRSG